MGERDETATDRELVEQALAGNVDAFAVLHRRYYARVFRLALLRCQNQSEAEDIAGETFVRAIAHLPGFRFRGESLFPWLGRICTNLVADGRRHRGGAVVVSLDAPLAEGVRALLEGLPSNAPDPHAVAERHEVQALVRTAIDTLPPDQARAVLLRFGGELGLKEIALDLGKTEGAIKALLHRAMIGLRARLLEGAHGAEVLGHLRHDTAADTRTQYGSQNYASTRPRL